MSDKVVLLFFIALFAIPIAAASKKDETNNPKNDAIKPSETKTH